MNWIDVTGATKKKRELAFAAAEFTIGELMPRIRTLDITIKLKRALEDQVCGWCEWQDDNVRPREFIIECDSTQSEDDFVTTILHEMVHVKQYATGELKERYKFGHRQLWKGRDYSDTDYAKQPWEKEAYKLQEVLYKKFLKS